MPDAGKGEEATGGVWVYDRRAYALRPSARVALITITRPSDVQVGGIKLGDAAAAIRRVGAGFVTTDVENTETYVSHQGVAYVAQRRSVADHPDRES